MIGKEEFQNRKNQKETMCIVGGEDLKKTPKTKGVDAHAHETNVVCKEGESAHKINVIW